MLVIFPITPSNPHTITKFTKHCGCSNAITYIKICCKYVSHISHDTLLQILTQLQHSQHTVAAVMQLYILKFAVNMLVIFPITPSNLHTITTFTKHSGCSNAIIYIKICCKYVGHISHYTFKPSHNYNIHNTLRLQ
jgi:hypothetical protein